jgi:hypothetical protein
MDSGRSHGFRSAVHAVRNCVLLRPIMPRTRLAGAAEQLLTISIYTRYLYRSGYMCVCVFESSSYLVYIYLVSRYLNAWVCAIYTYFYLSIILTSYCLAVF